MKKSQILELLKSVKYPGFSRDIVSFGLIKEIKINNDTINIDLALKTNNEEKKNEVVSSIKKILTQNFKQVAINIIDESPQKSDVSQG